MDNCESDKPAISLRGELKGDRITVTYENNCSNNNNDDSSNSNQAENDKEEKFSSMLDNLFDFAGFKKHSEAGVEAISKYMIGKDKSLEVTMLIISCITEAITAMYLGKCRLTRDTVLQFKDLFEKPDIHGIAGNPRDTVYQNFEYTYYYYVSQIAVENVRKITESYKKCIQNRPSISLKSTDVETLMYAYQMLINYLTDKDLKKEDNQESSVLLLSFAVYDVLMKKIQEEFSTSMAKIDSASKQMQNMLSQKHQDEMERLGITEEAVVKMTEHQCNFQEHVETG